MPATANPRQNLTPGPVGPQGTQGVQGVQGVRGTIRFKGNGPPPGDPVEVVNPQANDEYVDLTSPSLDLYIYNETP